LYAIISMPEWQKYIRLNLCSAPIAKSSSNSYYQIVVVSSATLHELGY